MPLRSASCAIGRPRKRGLGLLDPVRVLGQPSVVGEPLVDEHADDRGEQVGVATGLHRQPYVGEVGGLGAAGVDHDHRARVVGVDLLEHATGLVEAVAVPGVLAEEDRHLGVGEVAVRVGAEHAALDPRLTGLLLSERVGAPGDAEQAAGGGAVGPAEMVSLPTAAVVEAGVGAVLVGNGGEPSDDLGDRGVPVDLGVGAVGLALERAGQPALHVLVVVDAERLLAGVALGADVALVAADPGDLALVDAHLDAAVVAAEDAGGGVPHLRRIGLDGLVGAGRRGVGDRHHALPRG